MYRMQFGNFPKIWTLLRRLKNQAGKNKTICTMAIHAAVEN